MTPDPSLAHFARELQRAIPKGLPPFDADAFLNGAYQLPAELQSSARPVDLHAPDPGTNEVGDEVPDQVSAPEPADTSADLSNKRKKCRGLKKSGEPCRAYALAAGDLCIYHEADHVTNFNEARSRGGQANARRSILDFENLALDLHHRLDLQAMLETILRLQLSGSLPVRRGAQILRNLGIAERNLANIHRDRFANQHRDCETYARVSAALVEALPRIIENFELEMDAERARAIEDTGAKRAEYLKANQRYGPSPSPVPNHSPSHPSFRPAFLPTSPFANHPFLQP